MFRAILFSFIVLFFSATAFAEAHMQVAAPQVVVAVAPQVVYAQPQVLATRQVTIVPRVAYATVAVAQQTATARVPLRERWRIARGQRKALRKTRVNVIAAPAIATVTASTCVGCQSY